MLGMATDYMKFRVSRGQENRIGVNISFFSFHYYWMEEIIYIYLLVGEYTYIHIYIYIYECVCLCECVFRGNLLMYYMLFD